MPGRRDKPDPKRTFRRPPARRRKEVDSTIAQQAAGHSRIRADHAQELAEDYVELIAQLTRLHGEARTVEIAQRLGVSHVTVTKTLARLQRDGLVHTEPYRSIFLTSRGRDLAERAAARHELVVRFLRKLGVDEPAAEADAEGIEHHVSMATLEAMRRFVDGAG